MDVHHVTTGLSFFYYLFCLFGWHIITSFSNIHSIFWNGCTGLCFQSQWGKYFYFFSQFYWSQGIFNLLKKEKLTSIKATFHFGFSLYFNVDWWFWRVFILPLEMYIWLFQYVCRTFFPFSFMVYSFLIVHCFSFLNTINFSPLLDILLLNSFLHSMRYFFILLFGVFPIQNFSLI